jgi:hypothetical protein
MAANGISTLQYKRQRQDAKLALATTDRSSDGRRATLVVSQLPTRYTAGDNSSLDNNPNSGGLIYGRCWT